MMRVCNLDTCPMGIATQNPELRCRFRGKPEYVENFMRFVAQELREIMAKLGVAKVDDLIGRRSLRRKRQDLSARAQSVLLEDLLDGGRDAACHFEPAEQYPFHLEKTADLKDLLPAFEETLNGGQPESAEITVSSHDRAFGSILGSEITKRCGNSLPDNSVTVFAKGGG